MIDDTIHALTKCNYVIGETMRFMGKENIYGLMDQYIMVFYTNIFLIYYYQ